MADPRRSAPTRGRSLLLVAGVATSLVAPAAAPAAWIPSATGPAGDEQRVLAGGPGAATVVAAGDAGVATAAHAPGASGWATGAAAPVDADGSGYVLGDGGLVALIAADDDAQTVSVLRAGADGTLTSAGSLALSPDDVVDGGAAAPDGSLVIAVLSDAGRLTLHRRAPDGTWSTSTPAGTANVGATSAALGPTGVVTVAWVTVDGDDVAQQIGAVATGPGASGAPVVIADIADAASTVDDLVAVPSRDGSPAAVWTQASIEDEDGMIRGGGGPDDITELASGDAETLGASLQVASSPGRTLVRWLDPETATTTIGALDGSCSAATDLTSAVLVARGGEVAAVGGRAGRLAIGTVDGACGVAPDPSAGPAVATDAPLDAAADGEGTVVVAIGGDGTGTSTIAVDDRTAPRIDGLDVPGSATVGAPVTASASATDAWGVAARSWTVDGAATGTGGTLSTSFPAVGEHLVEHRASDVAGNATVAGRSVAVAEAPAPPPGTEPVAPPVTVPVPGPQPPATARPRRPSVRILGVRQGRDRRWTLRLRARDAMRLEISLFRERYVAGTAGRRRPATCPARPRPARRPPTGRRGRIVVEAGGVRTTVRLPRTMQQALAKRGRYTVRVVARGARGTRAATALRRFTVCG